MSHQLFVLAVLILCNTLCAVIIFAYGIIQDYRRRHSISEKADAGERKPDSLSKYILMSVFVFFCPIVGISFLVLGSLLCHLFFQSDVNLAAVTFSKERITILEQPDEEEEMNLVPIEEALIIDDSQNLRKLLLTILRGDVTKSLNAVAKALESPDTEASHYAASAIMDIMSEFQTTIQKFQAQLTANPEDSELNHLFIDYLYKILNSNILSEMEKKTYVYTMLSACQNYYEHNPSRMHVSHYAHIIRFLTEIGDLKNARIWVERIQKEKNDHADMYLAVLNFYFTVQDRECFFQCLDKLKHSGIAIGQELLELIRIYG